jgi:hypothetical protein
METDFPLPTVPSTGSRAVNVKIARAKRYRYFGSV